MEMDKKLQYNVGRNYPHVVLNDSKSTETYSLSTNGSKKKRKDNEIMFGKHTEDTAYNSSHCKCLNTKG
jgi:hypothetical protein